MSRPLPQRDVWRAPAQVSKYAQLRGWIDDGECVVLNAVADEVRGLPILDLGVGAGRTAWLLRLLTDDYTGVDWSPEMAAACRFAYPGIDARQGDARSLDGLPASHFALVLFSYNGIDNLDHEGRLAVLAEVRRVLRPSGLFAYSTSSKLGPMFTERPTLTPPRHAGEPFERFLARSLYVMAVGARRYRSRVVAWHQGLAAAEDHGDWGRAPIEALDFSLAHFTTIAAETKLLAEHGFTVERVVTDSGQLVSADAPDYPWFYVVARKTAP